MAKVKLDDLYNSNKYQENLNKAKSLGFKGTNASNFAIDLTAQDLQYDAGDLPEITVTPGVKRKYITDSNVGNRVTYNDYQGRQNMKDAQKSANNAAVVMAPAFITAAAPLVEMAGAAELGQGLSQLGYKYVPEAVHKLNYLFPGTNEFMSIYNAGKLGKTAAYGLTALEAAHEAGALKNFKENPTLLTGAEAALSVAPLAGSVAAKLPSYSDKAFSLNNSLKDFRVGLEFLKDDAKFSLLDPTKKFLVNKYTLAKKAITGDKRLRKSYDNWVTDLADTQRLSDALRTQHRALNVDLSNIERHPMYTEVFKSFPEYTQKVLNKIIKRTYPAFQEDGYYGHNAILGSRPYLTSKMIHREMGGLPHGALTIDFSKLSEENVLKLIGQRGANNKTASAGRSLLDERHISLGKNLKGLWELSSTEPETISSAIYTPEKFVNTSYSLHDFSDLSRSPLEGQIKFSAPLSETASPRLTLNTGEVNLNLLSQGGQESSKLLEYDPAYPSLLSKNIETLQSIFPGFVPFGSSVGVSKAKFPHASHDIDGIMTFKDFENWQKLNGNKYNIEQISKDTYRVNLFPLLGEEGQIDINVIREGADGNIAGERALEFARQFFPDRYTQYALDASLGNREASVKITPDELLKAIDPVSKSIADVFEINPIGTKSKQLGRALVYLTEADPDLVAKGLKVFANSHGATEQFPVSLAELKDVELNKKIIEQLGIGDMVNAEVIANDPKKMQNLLDYWYYNLTIYGRGVSGQSKEAILGALFDEWKEATNTGGNAMGAGRNAVKLGNSGYGPTYAFWQTPLKQSLNDGTVMDRINTTKMMSGNADYHFTPEQQQIIKNILDRFDIPVTEINTPADLLDNIPRRNIGQQVLTALKKELGINSLENGEVFGTGKYSSMTGRTDGPFIISNDRDNPVHLVNRRRRLLTETKGTLEIQSEWKDLGELLSKLQQGNNRRTELNLPISTISAFDIKYPSLGSGSHSLNSVKKQYLRKHGLYDLWEQQQKLQADIFKRLLKFNTRQHILEEDLDKYNRLHHLLAANKEKMKLVAAGTMAGVPLSAAASAVISTAYKNHKDKKDFRDNLLNDYKQQNPNLSAADLAEEKKKLLKIVEEATSRRTKILTQKQIEAIDDILKDGKLLSSKKYGGELNYTKFYK